MTLNLLRVVIKSLYWRLFYEGMKPHILLINTIRESKEEGW